MSSTYKAKTFLTPELKEQIVNFYKQGNNKLVCCDKFNVCYSSVDKCLKELYPDRPRSKKYTFNERYFEIIDTEAKAYFLGLIVADGTVRPDGTISIGLQGSDICILEKLKEEVDFTGNLRMTKIKSGKEFGTLFLCSPIMAKDLSKYGVIPRKSHYTYFPDISEELYNHFIRGVFDGDGWCVSRKDSKFGIIGNILLISKIQQVLILNCDLSQTSLRIDKRHNTPNIVTVEYGGTKQICRIRDYLYANATFFVKRKYDKMFSIVPFQLPEKPPCSVCGRPSHIKGMCKSHYEYNRIKSKR